MSNIENEKRLPSFDAIYKKYNRMVFNFLKIRVKDEMVAEELASDVMIKVHKSLHLYDEKIAQFNTWIINIAKNCMIDHFRKRTLSTVSLEGVYIDWVNGEETPQTDRLIQLNDSAVNPEEKLIQQETMRRMYNKFETLNEQEKTVAALHYFDGLSYEEVSTQLRMPLGTVKARLHRARVKLMEAFPIEMRKHVTA